MRLYEYEGKRLFRKFNIPVPESFLVGDRSAAGLETAVYPVVIKAQTLGGGRGRSGLVKFAENEGSARRIVAALLGRRRLGVPVKKLLVERRIDVIREYYLGLTIDRTAHRPLLLASAKGGVAIEETASRTPGLIFKHYFNAGDKLDGFKAANIVGALGFSGPRLTAAAAILIKLHRMFFSCECKLCEINPLALSRKSGLVALDAKVDLDEDAFFRHPEFSELGISGRHESAEMTEREKRAKAAAIPYVDLDGDIGVFPGGAGFGIAALDLIRHYGGRPANFMDSGGAPSAEKLNTMLTLLVDNPAVKAIFGARFGGISRCDDWAKAVVRYVIANKPDKPMIMRMTGNMEEAGRKILMRAKHRRPALFSKIKVYSYKTPIEDVIRETISVARGRSRWR